FLGHVAGDLGEADQLAVLVEEAIDDDAGPETRSVLAHPPGFIFVTPFARRRLERLRRPPGRAVLRRVEHADMPADDLVGAVALDPLAAEVPVGDPPLRVEHVDSVVGDPLHQQAELPLALGKRVCAALLFEQVGEADGKAGRLARLSADALDREAGGESAAVLARKPAAAAALTLPPGGPQTRGDAGLRPVRREHRLQ